MATQVLGNCTGTILYDFSNVGSVKVAPGLEARVRWEIIDQNWAERYTDIQFYLEVRYSQVYGYILKNGAAITVGYNPTSGVPDDGNKTFLEMTEKNVNISNDWTLLIQGTHRFTGAKYQSNSVGSSYLAHYMQVEVTLGIDLQYSLIDWAYVRGCSPIPTLHSVDQLIWNDAENPSFKVLIPSLDYFANEYSETYPSGLCYFFGDKRYLLRYDNIDTSSLALGVHHYTFNLTEAERESIWESMGKSTAKTYQFSVIAALKQPKVDIYETAQTVKMELTDSEPVINPEVVDINPVSIALTGNSLNLIRHVSNAQATINAEAQKLSTLTRIEIVNGDVISVVDESPVVFEKVSYGKFYFVAQDSRNLVKQKTLNPTFIEYIPMTCNIASESTTGDGQMKLIARGNYWIGNFGQVNNFVKVYYRYKKSGESEFSAWTLFSAVDSYSDTNTYEAYEYLDNLDYQSAYTFECYATDATGAIVYSIEKTISTVPIFDWGQRDFNFNVPVTIQGNKVVTQDQITSTEEIDEMFTEFREEMNVVKEDTAAISDRLIRALGSYEELSSSVTTLNAIVFKPVFIATLVGNNLHLSFSSTSSGSQWNNYAEGLDILDVELTNDGMITYMAPAIITNGLVAIETTNIEVTEDYITFTLTVKDVLNGTTYFSNGHGVAPVAINVNKF
jgi:hypothetical protein